MLIMASFPIWECLFICVLLYFGLGAQGAPSEDLIVKLPGQPEAKFKQYGGYITVDQSAGRASYYYFVEAENDSSSVPVTLWLNGGPGCSSMGGGAFTELGPFYPQGDGRGLRRNRWSWSKVSNLLFVESPAGVGWSYSNTSADYITDDESTAKDMLTFLLLWFNKYPEYFSRQLFLTGESYAGHYVPQLANKVLMYNKEAHMHKLNLQGIFIGNPLLRISVDFAASYEFLWSHGVISDETKDAIFSNCNFNLQNGNIEVSDDSDNCTLESKVAEMEIGNFTNEYDVIIDVCQTALIEQQLRLRKKITHISLGVDVCIASERSFYFNTDIVQRALHANITNLPYRWTMCSEFLNYSSFDEGINILPVLEHVIRQGIRVWIFSGDQDSVVPLIGSRANVRKLANDLGASVRIPYRAWYHKGQVGGWTTAYGDFLTFATVRGASHMVPFSQPARALRLFTNFILGTDLPSQ